MALTIETVLEDKELRVRWLPGTSRAMVTVFTGRHHEFGAQPADEFAYSAYAKGKNNVLFVSDLRQSWYSLPDLWDRIVGLIRDVIQLEGIERVVTLGNSMGGYGALLLPRDIAVQRALAFCPQLSMDAAVIAEDRWPAAQAKFGILPERNIADTIEATRTHYYVTAGTGAPRDIAQMDLLPVHPRINRWVLRGGGHNIAERLKEAGLLPNVIAALIRGNKPQIETLFAEYHAWLDRAGS
jgi:pimeloyl-ACP methyl ester carboxylesterase